MKYFLLLIFTMTLSSCVKVFSQPSFPPAFGITSDTVKIQRLDTSYYQILEDKQGKWTFDSIVLPALNNKFHKRGEPVNGIDTNNVHTYWQRYSFKNLMTAEANISLTAFVDYFDVYIKRQDSPWVHYQTGRLIKWSKRDGLKKGWSGYIPLALKPGEEIQIYDRREKVFEHSFNSRVRYESTASVINEEYVDYVENEVVAIHSLQLTEAFMIGILILALVFNFIYFGINKERVYLYFALVLVFMCIVRLYNISEAWTERENPTLNRYVDYLRYSWAFIYFFLIHFICSFFQVRVKYRGWGKFLVIIAWLWVFLNTVTMISLFYFTNIQQVIIAICAILFPVIPLLLLITVLLFIKQAQNFNRLVVLGSMPLFILYGVFGWVKTGTETPLFQDSFKWLYNGNFRTVETVCMLWFVLSFSLILFRRYYNMQRKQKAELEQEVAQRTKELNKSLSDLKLSQAQLIQSEKMASLGELTAGIAHEIQNPLNFVNNFSELNKELIEDLEKEITDKNFDEVSIIAKILRENEEKIHLHGKRADGIVKGMLQHSRASSSIKEPTDLTALADEYLRLAYHGHRAKDKSFNAILKTEYDKNIGKINIVSQDIGRVLLNLISNAFYAVAEKKKQSDGNYEPTISLSLKKTNDKILITIKDNGNGIPEKIREKIFQPFFTTKPTGEGTGLGLSISYDIIKAHGGELKVDTKEGEFAEFIISLPI